MSRTSTIRLTHSGFLLYSPISIFAFPISVKYLNPTASLFLLTLIGILITISSFIIYAGCIKIFKHHHSFVFIAASLSLVGFLRGLLFFISVNILDLKQPSSLSERMINSWVTTFIVLLLSNYIVTKVVNYRKRYQAIINQILQSSIPSKELLSSEDFAVLDGIQSSLGRSFASYLESLTARNTAKLSEEIRSQINNEIRPISQRIWLKSLKSQPIVNYRRLITDSVKTMSFSIRSLIVVLGIAGLIENLFAHSMAESVVRVGTYLLVLVILSFILKSLNTHFEESLAINVIFLALTGLLPIYMSEFAAQALGFNSALVIDFYILPLAPLVIVILSALNMSNKDRDLIMQALEQFNPLQAGERESKNLASYLHNSLQSDLMALSVQLEEASGGIDSGSSPELEAKVRELLNRSLVDDYLNYSKSPADRLTSIVQAWKGVCEISVNLDEQIWRDESRKIIVIRTIEEVITNAYRSGGATELKIVGTWGGKGFELKFTSNGGKGIATHNGFGTAWLDQIAIEPWILNETPSGAELIICL